MPFRWRPRRFWLFAALLVTVAALGVGIAVRADRSDSEQIVPYDPLPRW